MGVVWEARDNQLSRIVALKTIRGFAFSTESEKRRFYTEATAVAQFDHPNIVPIYDVAEFNSQPFFTMKLLGGGSLAGRLAAGALPAEEAAQIMAKLARAIDHAHCHGILHRDLKPDNVLFDDLSVPYLTDFGLAKLLDSDAGLTRTTAHVGTPNYMSPEQARGRPEDITAASDVWAAGALFYHMLTGRLPFAGNSSGEVFDRIANGTPEPMRSSGQEVDPQLERLCLVCMEKNPDNRLESAEVLADELDRWLAGKVIQTKRPAGWFSRHGLKAAAVLAAILLSVGAILFAIPTTPAIPTGDSENPPPSEPQVVAPRPQMGIELRQIIQIRHVILDATVGEVDAGLWLRPGDTISVEIDGAYAISGGPTDWTLVGEGAPPKADGDFLYPEMEPWALVGQVRPGLGPPQNFLLTEEQSYSGRHPGALHFALNIPRDEQDLAGGFVFKVVIDRTSEIFTAGSDPEKAWGAPLVKIDHDEKYSLYLDGQIRFSDGGQWMAAGTTPSSTAGDKALLVPEIDRHAVIAKVADGTPFRVDPGLQQCPPDRRGWLRVSVNDTVDTAGAYEDNSGAMTLLIDLYRRHQKLARQIDVGSVNLTPQSMIGGPQEESISLCLWSDSDSPRSATQVYLLAPRPASASRLSLRAVRIDADTYAFQVEGSPVPNGVDISTSNAYLNIHNDGTVNCKWSRDLYNRTFFQVRPALAAAAEPGAISLEPVHTPTTEGRTDERHFLRRGPDGSLIAEPHDGTDAFARSATWILQPEHGPEVPD